MPEIAGVIFVKIVVPGVVGAFLILAG